LKIEQGQRSGRLLYGYVQLPLVLIMESLNNAVALWKRMFAEAEVVLQSLCSTGFIFTLAAE